MQTTHWQPHLNPGGELIVSLGQLEMHAPGAKVGRAHRREALFLSAPAEVDYIDFHTPPDSVPIQRSS